VPEFTVVVPALAKDDHLRRCLDSLAGETSGSQLRRIIVG
jgi:hypothetical protein